VVIDVEFVAFAGYQALTGRSNGRFAASFGLSQEAWLQVLVAQLFVESQRFLWFVAFASMIAVAYITLGCKHG